MKKYVIVILIIGVYLLFTMLLLNRGNYFIVGNKLLWVNNSGKWEKVSMNKGKIRNISLYDFINNKYLGKYNADIIENKVTYNNYKYDDNISTIGYKGNKKIVIVSYEISYDVSLYEVSEIYVKENIGSNDSVKLSKIILDVDNDGINEIIYFLSNSLGFQEADKYYSLVYFKKGNNYTKIASKYSESPFYDKYNILCILDFTNDGNYEIILCRNDLDLEGNDIVYTMYGLKNGNYIEIASTE